MNHCMGNKGEEEEEPEEDEEKEEEEEEEKDVEIWNKVEHHRNDVTISRDVFLSQ